jgi:hypothetical protein
VDYKTKATSRKELRGFAKILRKLFDIPQTGAFPVLEVLDRLCDVFIGCTYTILDDSEFPTNTMARCTLNEDGKYTIEIRESVYNDAYTSKKGSCLGFICHEICHIFLFSVGFKPCFERSYGDNKLPAYCSVEWQAKALCAEVMIPFDESIGMSEKDIQETYHVSWAFADKRRKLEGR